MNAGGIYGIFVDIFFVKSFPKAQTEGTVAYETIETNMDNVFRKPLDM